jgi:hypothetical protein
MAVLAAAAATVATVATATVATVAAASLTAALRLLPCTRMQLYASGPGLPRGLLLLYPSIPEFSAEMIWHKRGKAGFGREPGLH